VALAYCGDGATSRGDFHESLNIAAVMKLPCIFVVENNQFAYSTPLHLQSTVDFASKAAAYGMPGMQVDGTDVLAMRTRMLEGHPNRSRLFDLKHDHGGMVDIEFIVQYLVLAFSHAHAQLLGNLGNITLLRIAAELQLIDPQLARCGADAYRDYRRLQHGLRLNAEAEQSAAARVAPERVRDETRSVCDLWNAVFELDGGKPA